LLVFILFGAPSSQSPPPVPVSPFQAGLEHYRAARYREALPLFLEAEKAASPDPRLDLFLGMSLGRLGEVESAHARLEKVLARAPRDQALFLSLGDFWLEVNQPEQAAAVLRRGLRLQQDSPEVLSRLARAYRELGLNKPELQVLERWLQVSPGDYEAGVKKAELLRRMGRYPEARTLAAGLARSEPTRMAAYEVLGRCPLSPSDAVPPETPFPAGRRPNLVLISIDTLRADRLHCYGNDRETSPNIDAFAGESVFFERAISQSPHTSPSHMSILTGMMPDVHQVANFNKDQGIVLSPRIATLAELLKRYGYLTSAFVGKGNLPAEKGFSRGFDRYETSFVRFTDGVNPLPAGLIRELDRRASDHRPFFLFLHHFFVHDPYIYGPEEFRSRFLVPGIKVEGLPSGYADFAEMNKTERAEAFWECFDPAHPDHLRHLIALYDGGVLFSDHMFGRILELLKERELYDNTIIVLLSDHGEEFFEHGNKGHMHLYVQELNVPLIIRFPEGGLGGTRIPETVRTVDVSPTILDFLGIPAGEVQGLSILPRIRGKGSYEPDVVSFSVIRPGGTVRVEEKKLSYSNEITERLYELGTDPAESTNVISTNPAGRKLLREEARKRQEEKAGFIARIGSPIGGGPVEMTPEIEADMRALGYL